MAANNLIKSSLALSLLINITPTIVLSGNCNYFEHGPFGIGVIEECGAFFESNVYFLGQCVGDDTPISGTFQDDLCTTVAVPSGPTGGNCNNPTTGCSLYLLDVELYGGTTCGIDGGPNFNTFSVIVTDGAAGQCISIPNDSRFSSFLISNVIDENGYGFNTYDSTDCSGPVTREYLFYEGCNVEPFGSSADVTITVLDDGSSDATPAPVEED